jgi:RNA polymerase sigma factor (sigma-70 family)
MSPASLRRYRAERLLREEFRSLRASVIASVRCKLHGCGAELADDDLDACYSQAWQGLYLVTLAGEEVLNPGAWLALATFRRAIDEHRAARRRHAAAPPQRPLADLQSSAEGPAGRDEVDPAGELDRRQKLGQLFEALRLRLSPRERRAFALCYLQGLSRAEAAATMGLSERRMRKLMDGRGAGDAGTNAKVSALVSTIRAERWCEEQGSLMRGLAYGVLDPHGERHRLAVMHTRSCPACRSYVASLRGLAALLPPAPALALLVGASRAARDATRHTAATAHASAGAGVRGSGAIVAPAAAASGTVGAGAAGGGWLLIGGGAGAKLAATCLLALGLGAGCAALTVTGSSPHRRGPSHSRAAGAQARLRTPAITFDQPQTSRTAAAPALAAITPSAQSESAITPAARAGREFGPEQPPVPEGSQAPHSSPSSAPRASVSRSTAAAREFNRTERPSSRASGAASPAARPANEAPATESAGAAVSGEGGPAQAQREFSPG